MKRVFAVLLAAALTLGVSVAAWATQFIGRCPGKCPLCP